jgi:hypothetical protein
MNKGERDEIIVQLKLIQLREIGFELNDVGVIKSIKLKHEYRNLPKDFKINAVAQYTDIQLTELARQCGISKANTRSKADTIINGENFSIKSKNNAPPALVNHTTRPGFEFAANHSGGDINKLDAIIDEYWDKRINKTIGEDVSNTQSESPFRTEKETMRPFLNYFLFDGTGSSVSALPANRILGFTDPLDIDTWHIYDKANAIDMYWNNMIFSLRAKKGMPANYPDITSKKLIPYKPSIDKWTRYIDGDYRGALHIRTR